MHLRVIKLAKCFNSPNFFELGLMDFKTVGAIRFVWCRFEMVVFAADVDVINAGVGLTVTGMSVSGAPCGGHVPHYPSGSPVSLSDSSRVPSTSNSFLENETNDRSAFACSLMEKKTGMTNVRSEIYLSETSPFPFDNITGWLEPGVDRKMNGKLLSIIIFIFMSSLM